MDDKFLLQGCAVCKLPVPRVEGRCNQPYPIIHKRSFPWSFLSKPKKGKPRHPGFPRGPPPWY